VSLLVVGSLAYDTVETPFGKAEDVFGGAAAYFTTCASYFGPVQLVGVAGKDFRDADRALLEKRGVDLGGLEVRDGRTFRWKVRYDAAGKVEKTLATELNVLAGWRPQVPAAYRDARFVFLANSAPSMQLEALAQLPTDAFVVCDTMDLWIGTERENLLHVLRRSDMAVLNDEEARELAGERSLIRAGRKLLDLGPSIVMVKKGEHGAFLWSRGFFFATPAYPVDEVVDPTGAGDAFAGGVLGYLADAGIADEEHLKRAMIYGNVLASYAVESFSLDRLREVDRKAIDRRYQEFLRFTAHPT